MLRDYVQKLIPKDNLKAFCAECDIFNSAHHDDTELYDAYVIYRLFYYLGANDSSSRISTISKLQELYGNAISSEVLETVGILIKKDTYEHQQCEDVDTIVQVKLLEPRLPLGYVSEEVKRCFTMHAEINDEDVESSIDSILQTFIKIFFLKSEEVRTVAIRNKMLLFNIIKSIVMEEADLNLMLQVKEIGQIVLEWSDSYV